MPIAFAPIRSAAHRRLSHEPLASRALLCTCTPESVPCPTCVATNEHAWSPVTRALRDQGKVEKLTARLAHLRAEVRRLAAYRETLLVRHDPKDAEELRQIRGQLNSLRGRITTNSKELQKARKRAREAMQREEAP